MKKWMIFLVAGLASTAQAENEVPNLTFNGSIIAEGCDVAVASENQTVHIGDFSVAVFSGTGSVSSAKNFEINLENCVGKGSITFSGESNTDNGALLALTNATGEGDTASGVAIEILDLNSGAPQPLPLGQASSLYTLKSGDNTLRYQLRYKATQNIVTPGSANAVMYFDMLYQ
ncbi:fimbrial protein [Citrobacter europaeus]|uniref:fimbrial protein n=1 Tax=Citrobacter europaeus TaxID=1914243 RepID=UPI001BD192ED|nr:fimbrial protein [Citrobacter europaeus]